MKARPRTSQKWKNQIQTLWPALKGSLARVCKPCIRKGCPACARGDKHPAWLRAFTQQGRRRCMHVPVALVPLLRRALQNGRRLEALLYQAGPALIREYRRNQAVTTTRKPSVSIIKSTTSVKNRKMKS